MKKLYDKNELSFSLLLIGIYVLLHSLADSISTTVGIRKIITAPLCIGMTAVIYVFISKNGLKAKYGFCKPTNANKSFLWYLPLVLIASTNLWMGIKINFSFIETFLGILSMIFVGFLEEVIFRGFLFRALERDNIKSAIIISSVTFGLGHIVNLLNGQELVPTLLQICYAISIGFLFTIMVYKGRSIWPCVVTHSLINGLSVVANRADTAHMINVFSAVFLCVVPALYSFYILKHTQ